MTKSQLKVLKKEELLDEAKKLGLKVAAHLRKDELVEWIIDWFFWRQGNQRDAKVPSASDFDLLKKLQGRSRCRISRVSLNLILTTNTWSDQITGISTV